MIKGRGAVRCPRCGYNLDFFEEECPACRGREPAASSWACNACGARNPHDAASCRGCGAVRVKRAGLAKAKLATFLYRVLAQFIDGIVVLLIVGGMVIAGLAISPEWGLEGQTLMGLTVNLFVLVAAVVVGIIYHTILVSVFGATVGKLVLNMQVIRTEGAPVGWWTALFRATGLFASLATLGLIFLLIVRDRSNQGLHDKLADTIVVRG